MTFKDKKGKFLKNWQSEKLSRNKKGEKKYLARAREKKKAKKFNSKADEEKKGEKKNKRRKIDLKSH